MKFVQFTAPNGSPVHINAEDVTLLRGTDEDLGAAKGGRTEIMMVSGASQVIKESLQDALATINTTAS